MERALFVNRLAGELPAGYDRLYCGAEFCPWMLPSPASLRGALRAARAAGMTFTLATPVLLETSFTPLRRSLEELLPELGPEDEVLISDLGALELVRELAPQQTVILGRVLSGQKRGPQILDLDLSAADRAYFREGSWYATEARALLAELGIARVELDNLLQGIAPLPAGLAGSLHYPYAMVASSRNCPYRTDTDPHLCSVHCGEVFTLESPRHQVPLLQGGNTQFLRNDELPDDLPGLGIDRLVYHPLLPR